MDDGGETSKSGIVLVLLPPRRRSSQTLDAVSAPSLWTDDRLRAEVEDHQHECGAEEEEEHEACSRPHPHRTPAEGRRLHLPLGTGCDGVDR